MSEAINARTLAKGVGWTTCAQLANFGLRFITIPILTRLLAPEQFGVVAVSLTVMAFLGVFGTAGLGPALIVRRSEDQDAWSSAFWTSTAVGIAFGLAVYLFAGPLSELLGAPDSKLFLQVFCLLFPIQLAVGLLQARVQLLMSFDKLARWMVISDITGSVAAVIAAFAGMGAWSLVIQQFVSVPLKMAGLAWSVRFFPRLRYSTRKVGELIGFGARITLVEFTNFLVLRAPILIIGRILGLDGAGSYWVAMRLADLPNQIVLSGAMQVLFPAFSKLAGQPQQVAAALLRTSQMTTALLAPFLFGLWAVAEPATAIVFGSEWLHVAPVLGLIAFAKGLLTPFVGSTIPFLQGIGRADVLLRLTLFRAVLTIAGCLVGVRWGLVGVAASLCVAHAVAIPFYAAVAFRIGRVPYRRWIREVVPIYLLAMVMAFLVRIVIDALQASFPSNLALAALGVSMGVGIYVTGLFVIGRPVIESLRSVLFRAPKSKPSLTE